MSTVGLRLQFGNLLIPSGSHVGRSMPMTGMLHGSICICVCIVLYLCAGWSVFDCRSALATTWEATSSSYSTTRSSLASFAFSYWSSSDYSWSLNFFSSYFDWDNHFVAVFLIIKQHNGYNDGDDANDDDDDNEHDDDDEDNEHDDDDDDDDNQQRGGRGREEGRSPMFLSNVFPAIKYGLSSSLSGPSCPSWPSSSSLPLSLSPSSLSWSCNKRHHYINYQISIIMVFFPEIK